MSFGFTGIYWLNHQHVIRRAERAGHSLQIANLGFLFCLSLLPLSTAYVVDKQLSVSQSRRMPRHSSLSRSLSCGSASLCTGYCAVGTKSLTKIGEAYEITLSAYFCTSAAPASRYFSLDLSFALLLY